MAKDATCPKCHRKGTCSAKWLRCSACLYGELSVTKPPPVTESNIVTPESTEPEALRNPLMKPGRPRVHVSNAQRQKAYRERNRG